MKLAKLNIYKHQASKCNFKVERLNVFDVSYNWHFLYFFTPYTLLYTILYSDFLSEFQRQN